MKKTIKFLTLGLCVALGAVALTACGEKKPSGVPDGYARVSFMDGQNLISYSDVKIGEKVAKPDKDPSKDGYEFVRWCATPNYSLAYDFDEEIEESKSVYAGYRSTAADNHTWYLAGQSFSDIFEKSGKFQAFTNPDEVPEEILLQRVEGTQNKFSITHDFYVGDKIQILNTDDGWNGQIGYGYVADELYSADTSAMLYGVGNPFDGAANKSDSVFGQSGNYTITLAVDADGKLTEFTYVRNGDAAKLPEEYNYYFKGKEISAWQNVTAQYNQFETEDRVTYTRELSMYAGEEFMFIGTVIGDTTGKINDIGRNLITLSADEKTAAALSSKGNNFTIAENGTYKFTLVEGEDGKLTLSAEKTSGDFQQFDFYVKGSMGGDKNWAERHEMTESGGKYSYTVELAENDEFQIVVTDDGVPPAEGLESDKFNISTSSANKKNISSHIDISGNNFKATAVDTYTITIDPVTMLVSVTGEHDAKVFKTSIYGKVGDGTTGAWADAVTKDISNDGENLSCEIEVDLKAGNEFGFRTMLNGEQIGWLNGANEGWTTCDGLDGSAGDIKCTADGKYRFVITIDVEGEIISVTASVVA